MSTKEIINAIVKKYRMGLMSYGDAEDQIIKILHCDSGDAGSIIYNGF